MTEHLPASYLQHLPDGHAAPPPHPEPRVAVLRDGSGVVVEFGPTDNPHRETLTAYEAYSLELNLHCIRPYLSPR